MLPSKRSKALLGHATLCFLIPIVLGQTVSGRSQSSEPATSRTQQEDDIREAVLRSQMLEWIKGEDEGVKAAKSASDREIAEHFNFKTFYVSVDEKDPSEDFLTRFKDIPRSVKKLSESEIDKRYRLTVVDKKTHKPGIIFYVGKLEWKKSDSVEIKGGYHCDGLCAAGITFRLKLVKGTWIIEERRTNWIS
jgi:hypothetical protein